MGQKNPSDICCENAIKTLTGINKTAALKNHNGAGNASHSNVEQVEDRLVPTNKQSEC